MIQVTIDDISGETLPINVYITDVYGNNKTLLGTITNPVPPSIEFYTSSPSVFDNSPEFIVVLEDANSCIINSTNVC